MATMEGVELNRFPELACISPSPHPTPPRISCGGSPWSYPFHLLPFEGGGGKQNGGLWSKGISRIFPPVGMGNNGGARIGSCSET